MSKPGSVHVLGLGGTIAMTGGASGLTPALALADLLAAAGLDAAGVEARDIAAVPSANLTFDHMADLAMQIEQARADGASGVVVVQGTDSLEETAFAVELLCALGGGVVFTGAMRAPAQTAPDGPANILAAIAGARAAPSGLGVLATLNDEFHAARWVAKRHTTALGAFGSPDHGPMGRMHEGQARFSVDSLPPLARLTPGMGARPKVALLPVAMDPDGVLFEALPDLGFAGLVVEAMGAGHVAERLVRPLERLAGVMPVVLCSRTGAGRVCERTYGYPGAETDLIRRGLIPGGGLNGLKARVALTLALAEDPASAGAVVARIGAAV